MDAWWFKPLLVLPTKVREIIDEWSSTQYFDEYLAEEYGRQIESMVDAAQEWLSTAPEGETRQQVQAAVDATLAMKSEIRGWFGPNLL